MTKNRPCFTFSKDKASELLFMQDSNSFPIDVKKIDVKNIKLIISSFQEYSKLVNIPIDFLTNNGEYNDGYIIPCIRDNTFLILYNEEIETEGRIRWTIAHEIGHVYLGHESHSNINEIEANSFAAQLLLPQCVLKELIHKGKNVVPNYIQQKFGLSKEAAENSIAAISSKLDSTYKSQYDDIILEKYNDFIQRETRGCKYYNYDEEEEMNKKRSEWFY